MSNKWIEDDLSHRLTKAMTAAFGEGPSAAATQRAQAALRKALAIETKSKAGGSETRPYGGTATIFYDLVEKTPLGPVWVAAGPRGLVAVEYDGSEANFRAYLVKHIKCQPVRSAEKVGAAKGQVRKYLLGQSNKLDLDVDLGSITPFQRRVLEETRKVPRGQVSTYAEIARRIGNPKAVRAVGQALRNNPMPIVVPCHRIIASDGTLGGYGGRMRDKRKIELLRLEGATLA